MTREELDRLARELATACNECDAGRLAEDDFEQMLNHAIAGKSDEEKHQIHLRMAQLQGRSVFVLRSDGEIEATNDEAEAIARRLTDKLS
jgi:hypothetical protein